jgi:biotin carboxylase
MGASIGVVLAACADKVRSAFHIAEDAGFEGAHSYQGGALVEEFLDGPEISVDAAVVDGRYLPMFLARKRVGMFPYFEEIGHTVDPGDPLRADPGLLRVLRTAHRAIGLRYGITHTELKLTARGPVIVEINGRLGGDLIPLLGQLATGIDPGVVAVEVAIGRRPELVDSVSGARQTVGIRFGYPPLDCEVRTISVPRPDRESGVLRTAALAGPGSRLRLPPGDYIARHSYVICAGDTPRDCERRLDTAAERVRLEWAELDAAPLTDSIV